MSHLDECVVVDRLDALLSLASGVKSNDVDARDATKTGVANCLVGCLKALQGMSK